MRRDCPITSKYLLGTQVEGIVALGSTGEFASLSFEEKKRVYSVVSQSWKEEGKKEKTLIAGVGSNCAKEVETLTEEASSLGFKYAMVLTPHYYLPSMQKENTQINFFEKMASKSKLPIILYNIPQFTGVNLSPVVISVLSKNDKIVGMKDSSGNVGQIQVYAEASRESRSKFSILGGSASTLYASLCSEADGGIVALANLLPQESCLLFQLFSQGRHKEAALLQNILSPVNRAVTSTFGIAGLKKAIDYLSTKRKDFSLYGGIVRNPLLPFDEKNFHQLKAIIDNFLDNLNSSKSK